LKLSYFFTTKNLYSQNILYYGFKIEYINKHFLNLKRQKYAIFRHGIFPPAVVFLKNTTALKMAEKKYHGEGKIGENHNICGKIA
jgi:hypothetical protein